MFYIFVLEIEFILLNAFSIFGVGKSFWSACSRWGSILALCTFRVTCVTSGFLHCHCAGLVQLLHYCKLIAFSCTKMVVFYDHTKKHCIQHLFIWLKRVWSQCDVCYLKENEGFSFNYIVVNLRKSRNQTAAKFQYCLR